MTEDEATLSNSRSLATRCQKLARLLKCRGRLRSLLCFADTCLLVARCLVHTVRFHTNGKSDKPLNLQVNELLI